MSKGSETTQALYDLLANKECKYSDFYKAGKAYFIENSPIEFWAEKKRNCAFKNNEIINRADIGYAYFYDIINGKKKPSREKLVRIFLAMKFDLEGSQNALRIYSYADLSPKNKRDSIFIYSINHGFSIVQLNELLKENDEEEIK